MDKQDAPLTEQEVRLLRPNKARKYGPKIIKETDKYIDTHYIPSKQGLADALGVSVETIDNWFKKYKGFAKSYRRLQKKNRMNYIREFDLRMVQDIADYIDNEEFPILADIANKWHVTTRQLHKWREKYKELDIVMARLEDKQRAMLIRHGLFNKQTNASVAQFLLKAMHGMVETDRRMLVGADGGDLKIKVINYGDDSTTTTVIDGEAVDDSLQLQA